MSESTQGLWGEFSREAEQRRAELSRAAAEAAVRAQRALSEDRERDRANIQREQRRRLADPVLELARDYAGILSAAGVEGLRTSEVFSPGRSSRWHDRISRMWLWPINLEGNAATQHDPGTDGTDYHEIEANTYFTGIGLDADGTLYSLSRVIGRPAYRHILSRSDLEAGPENAAKVTMGYTAQGQLGAEDLELAWKEYFLRDFIEKGL